MKIIISLNKIELLELTTGVYLTANNYESQYVTDY